MEPVIERLADRIRSLDKKRYYLLRAPAKEFSHTARIWQSARSSGAATFIGYLGRTGYSIQENVNNLKTSHLHFGMQLIFRKRIPKECLRRDLDRCLRNRASAGQQALRVSRDPETKDYFRVYDYRDTSQITE